MTRSQVNANNHLSRGNHARLTIELISSAVGTVVSWSQAFESSEVGRIFAPPRRGTQIARRSLTRVCSAEVCDFTAVRFGAAQPSRYTAALPTVVEVVRRGLRYALRGSLARSGRQVFGLRVHQALQYGRLTLYVHGRTLQRAVGAPLVAGSSLCLLEMTDGTPAVRTLLSDSTGVIRDPDVSYTADRVLFAWKKSDRLDDYHLHELDLASGIDTVVIFLRASRPTTATGAEPRSSSPRATARRSTGKHCRLGKHCRAAVLHIRGAEDLIAASGWPGSGQAAGIVCPGRSRSLGSRSNSGG